MYKRFFTLLVILVAFPVLADAPRYLPGIQYQLVQPPQPVSSTSDQVEVVEFLWYGCETCFLIQDGIARWVASQGGKIKYVRLPAVTDAGMVLLARAFYAADTLGVHEQIDGPLFTAIHRYQRRFDSESSVVEFFNEHGVPRERAREAMRSGTTAAKVRHAQLMARRYGIRGAPTLVVAGKYRVDPSLVHSVDELIDVVDFLVQSERTGPH